MKNKIFRTLFLIIILPQICFQWHIVAEEFRQTDLASFGISGWQLNGNALSTTNKVEECQTVLLKIQNTQTLQKHFVVQYYEFTNIRIEFNAYLYDVSDSTILITIAGNTETYQVVVANTTPSNNLCSNNLPSLQYLFNYIEGSSSQTIDISITFNFVSTGNPEAFLGIRDLIIFTDSPVSMNGCPLELPILSIEGNCVTACLMAEQQLSGHYLNKCIVPDDTNFVQGFPLLFQSVGGNVDLIYQGTDVSYYRLDTFTQTNSILITEIVNSLTVSGSKLQIQGSTYLIDFDIDSQFTIKFNSNHLFSAHKTDSDYVISPIIPVQECKITIDGIKKDTMATLINSEILIDSTSSQSITIDQQLQFDTVTYAFLNQYYYLAQGTKYCNSFVSYIYCISCISPYWAYRGQCDDNCPLYTIQDYENRKCIDLIEYETQFNIPNIQKNAFGYYLTKISQNDLSLQTSDIEFLFSQVPLSSNNYQNTQKYSLLPNMKMIGGYNSWGYGSYKLEYTSISSDHYQIRIFADLYLFDDWTNTDYFYIYVDGILIDTISITGLTQSNIYGQKNKDYFKKLFYKITHQATSLNIEFKCRGSSGDASLASCGLTNLFVLYDQDITRLCTLQLYYSFVDKKCYNCDPICSTLGGCQLESTRCNNCHFTCQSCDGTTAYDCLSCQSEYHRTLVGKECQCMTGYDEEISSGMCTTQIGCHYSCLSCYKINNPFSCAACPSQTTTHRISGNKLNCVCESGYEDSGNQICAQSPTCHPSCNTCSIDNSSTDCLSCPSNAVSHRTFIPALNTCQCDTDYIEVSPIQQNCVLQCHKTCESCTIANSATHCTSCADNTITHRTMSATNTCPCDPGYEEQTPIDSNCVPISPCHYSCQICSTINNSSTCLSCPSNGTSHRTLIGNSCNCDSGYSDIANQQNCVIQCHPQCQTCSLPNSSIDCVSCSPSQFRQLNTSNECICMNGYSEQPGNLICLIQCHYTCATCSIPNNINGCTTCPSNSITHRIAGPNNNCVCQSGYFEKTNQVICELLCHYSCDTCSLSNDQNACITCNSASHRTLIDSSCTCADGYIDIVGQQDCAMACHYTCKTCSQSYQIDKCLDCPSHRILDSQNQCACKQGYLEVSQTNCQPICHQNCLTCYDILIDNCLSCDSQFNRILKDNQCICDEGFIETIDDLLFCKCQNGYYFDNSYCLKCSQVCLTCSQYDQCTSCPISKVLRDHQCTCQDYHWIKEIDSDCISCDEDDGWLNEQCIKRNCGDGLFTYGEQCDDGNVDPRDGCDHCVRMQGYTCLNKPLQQSICFKCGDSCKECLLDGQCILCDEGSQLQNGTCQKCQENCSICQQSKCLKCQIVPQFISEFLSQDQQNDCPLCEDIDGLYSNSDGTDCIAKCGDQILVTITGEQCDDGNNVDYDGCSSTCQIEVGFECQGTQCIAIHPPTPTLSEIQPLDYYINQRVFKLSYDTLLMDYVNVTNHLSFQIESKDSWKDYKISLKENQEDLYELRITLELLNSFNEDRLQVVFENPQQIIGKNGLSQVDETIYVDISNFEFVSEDMKQVTQQVSSLNKYILYILLGMICLAVLLGGLDAFWNLLDLIQILSYIQFIDTRYPYNLSKFLELFEFGQLKFLDDLIKVQSLITICFDQVEIESYQPKGILAIYVDSCLFIINIQSTVTAFVIVFSLYIASSFVINISIQAINYLQIQFFNNYSILKKVYQVSTSLIKYVNTYKKQFFWNVLIRTHMSTAYDISFAIFLQFQLKYSELQSTVAKGSYFVCIIICLFQIICVLFYFSKLNVSNASFQQPQFQNSYGEAIFESLEVRELGKIKTYYNIFLLMKRIIHMLFLISFSSVPQIQSASISLLEMINIMFLLLTNPLGQYGEFIKQTQCEILVYMIHIQIFLFTLDDQIQLLSEYGRILIGWICVGQITLVIIIQLIIDIGQQLKYLIEHISFIKNIYRKIFYRNYQGKKSETNEIFRA